MALPQIRVPTGKWGEIVPFVPRQHAFGLAKLSKPNWQASPTFFTPLAVPAAPKACIIPLAKVLTNEQPLMPAFLLSTNIVIPMDRGKQLSRPTSTYLFVPFGRVMRVNTIARS